LVKGEELEEIAPMALLAADYESNGFIIDSRLTCKSAL
jgi:hypothetical protein